MRSNLAVYQGARNYRSYNASGTDHTLTRSAKFYTESSAGGIPFVDWVATMQKPQAGTPSKGGKAWTNATCTGDCGAIPPGYCPF
jgi:hypothetical protein